MRKRGDTPSRSEITEKVETAKPGDAIGIKVPEKVRQNDKVFKVTE